MKVETRLRIAGKAGSEATGYFAQEYNDSAKLETAYPLGTCQWGTGRVWRRGDTRALPHADFADGWMDVGFAHSRCAYGHLSADLTHSAPGDVHPSSSGLLTGDGAA
jgi:hypothetical protein